MIGPAPRCSGLPRLRCDGLAEGDHRACRGGAAGAEAEPGVERRLRFPGSSRRQNQTSVLGRSGFLPLLQGIGMRPVSVAVAGGGDDPADLGATGDALGGDRLAAAGMDRTARPRCLILLSNSIR